jgi:hypothetical protein
MPSPNEPWLEKIVREAELTMPSSGSQIRFGWVSAEYLEPAKREASHASEKPAKSSKQCAQAVG